LDTRINVGTSKSVALLRRKENLVELTKRTPETPKIRFEVEYTVPPEEDIADEPDPKSPDEQSPSDPDDAPAGGG
jgi:hypothetical protein